jgi:Protein of unknown function (DUF2845)
MANSASRAFILLASIALVGVAVADENMRCGSKIIVTGMTRSEVLTHCGEPTAKSEEVLPVRTGNQVVGHTVQYRWTYEAYSQTRVLLFDQDKLMSIQ